MAYSYVNEPTPFSRQGYRERARSLAHNTVARSRGCGVRRKGKAVCVLCSFLASERASERVAVASAGTAVDLQDLQLQGPTESAIATENNTHCEDTQNEIPKMNKLTEADERRAILLGFIYSFGG